MQLVEKERQAAAEADIPYIEVSETLQRLRSAHQQLTWFAPDGMHPGKHLALLNGVLVYEALHGSLPSAKPLVVNAPVYGAASGLTETLRSADAPPPQSDTPLEIRYSGATIEKLINSLQAKDCVPDRENLLSLDLSDFDQNLNGGWRKISADPGCTLAAADLILEYRTRKEVGGTTLIFHEAQLRAKAGQHDRAIPLFRDSMKDPGDDHFGWNHYVEATIAFLERDRERLLESRDALAGLEKPEGFRAVDQDGNEMEIPWPPNLHIVERFIGCFDRPYSEAYGGCKSQSE